LKIPNKHRGLLVPHAGRVFETPA